ncbi:MAG TPA: hypothetical protein VK892_08290, partial [Pyrinomonadaceae bacterium]|nr:hypothetical protein [Pyrinomonadaceae bacterium]
MIKIKENTLGKFRLVIDEREVNAKVTFDKGRNEYTAIINEIEVAEQLMNYEFNELPNIYYLAIPITTNWSKALDKLYIRRSTANKFELKFRFNRNSKNWKDNKYYFKYLSSFSVAVSEFNGSDLKLREELIEK